MDAEDFDKRSLLQVIELFAAALGLADAQFSPIRSFRLFTESRVQKFQGLIATLRPALPHKNNQQLAHHSKDRYQHSL